MIVKKKTSLRGKILLGLIFKIGFIKKSDGLHVLFFINRKRISKIIFCIAKKKIRSSVIRNIMKRRIRIAYSFIIQKIEILKIQLLIICFLLKTQIPSIRKFNFLIKRIYDNIMIQMLA